MNRLLVFSENKTLFLDTSLSSDFFAKSRLADRLGENGWLAEKTSTDWKFSPWKFTETHQNECYDENLSPAARRERETISFKGPAFSGRTLKALFDLDFSKELGETELSFVTYAAARTCSALESASRQKIDLYNIGAGGIFISSDYQKMIFLPRRLFEMTMECAGKESAAEYNGIYINPQLKEEAAINYTQSVIAYRMLTGTFPFTQIDPMKRMWDIHDRNYIPIKNKVWALNEKLSFFIDNALQRKSKIISHGKKKGEKKRSIQEKISTTITESTQEQIEKNRQDMILSFPLAELFKETGLTEKGEIPEGGQVHEIIRKSTVSHDEFEKRAKKDNASFQKKLSRKRWIRKHQTQVAISCVALVAAGIITAVAVSTYGRNPTSKSLTSLNTVEMFYSGLNELDAMSMKGCSSGAANSRFINMVNAIYVASKTKSTYNASAATVSPAKWFCFNYDRNYNIYGISNLTIDGIEGNTFFKGPLINSKPKAITKEFGTSVTEGSSKDFLVRYNLIQTENEDSLFITDESDEVHMIFYKGRWVITAIITHENKIQELSFQTFKDDFKSAWDATNENPKATAELLREKYPWVPSDLEIDGGQKATDMERNPFSLDE